MERLEQQIKVGLDVASASDCPVALVPNTNTGVSFPSCEMGQPPLPWLAHSIGFFFKINFFMKSLLMYLFYWIFVFFIGIYCTYLFYFIGCFTQLRQFLMYRHVNQSHVSTRIPPFGISFLFRSAQSTEGSSLCRPVGSPQLPALFIVVDTHRPQPPNSSQPPPPCLGICVLVLYI